MSEVGGLAQLGNRFRFRFGRVGGRAGWPAGARAELCFPYRFLGALFVFSFSFFYFFAPKWKSKLVWKKAFPLIFHWVSIGFLVRLFMFFFSFLIFRPKWKSKLVWKKAFPLIFHCVFHRFLGDFVHVVLFRFYFFAPSEKVNLFGKKLFHWFSIVFFICFLVILLVSFFWFLTFSPQVKK